MNDSKLTYEDITPLEAAAYIDDHLLALLGGGNAERYTVGGHSIAVKRKGETVGVVTFSLDGVYPLIHPKVKREHAIYAKRVCDIGLDYLKGIGFKVAVAVIPSTLKPNVKIAEACGMNNIYDDLYGVSLNG